MADQDYPLLYAQLTSNLVEMKATIQIAQEIIYASTGDVQTPTGLQASIAKRVEDRISQITGVEPVTWTSITGKPVNFPASWDSVTGKPTNYPTNWGSISNKPTSYPTNWDSITGKPSFYQNPMSSVGDLVIGGANGAAARLSGDGAQLGYVLTWFEGTPAWRPPTGGSVSWSSIQDVPEKFPAAPDPVQSVPSGAPAWDWGFADKYVRLNNPADAVLQVPLEPEAGAANMRVDFEQAAAGRVTFEGAPGVTINRRSGLSATITGRFGVASLKRTAPNVWTLFGDLVPASGPGPDPEPVLRPEFIGSTFLSQSASSHTLSIPSAAQAGDLLMVVASTRADRSISTPSGWGGGMIGPPTGGGGTSGKNDYVFTKVHDGSSANATFAQSTAGASSLGLVVYRKGKLVTTGQGFIFQGWGSTTNPTTQLSYTPFNSNSVIMAAITGLWVDRAATPTASPAADLRGYDSYLDTGGAGGQAVAIFDLPSGPSGEQMTQSLTWAAPSGQANFHRAMVMMEVAYDG